MTPHDRIQVEVTSGPIDLTASHELAGSSDGAVVTFLGVVRDSTDDRPVAGLDYEAFDELAAKEMTRIAEVALERWPIGRVAIVHRTGSLSVGEVSVLISVSSPHRGEAFDACEFLIDTLKKEVPIWKKELFEDGTASWADHA